MRKSIWKDKKCHCGNPVMCRGLCQRCYFRNYQSQPKIKKYKALYFRKHYAKTDKIKKYVESEINRRDDAG